MDPKEFRDCRLFLGLSQRQLGRELDKSHITISRYENGHLAIPRSIAYHLRDLANGYRRKMNLELGRISNYPGFQTLRTVLDHPDADRELFVLAHRFGLVWPKLTLREVGDALGVTRERARQIEAIALRRLRQKRAVVQGVLEDWANLAECSEFVAAIRRELETPQAQVVHDG